MKPYDRNLRDRETAFTGRIIACVSHEFMNVLATIRESSGLVEDIMALDETPFPFREKVERGLSIILAQVKRGMEIGNGLNRFAHSMDDTKMDLDVNELLEQLSFLMDRFVRMKGVRLRVEPLEAPMKIQTDLFRLQAVLFTCIEYCMDHTETGGLITLQGQRRKEGISIHCTSRSFNGPAEDAENLQVGDPGLKALLGSIGARLSVLNSQGKTGLEVIVPVNN